MPFYSYRCENEHEITVFSTMAERKDEITCFACELTAKQMVLPPRINGGQITDKTRELLRAPFGRKRADSFKTVKDIDNALDTFKKTYGPMIGEPGRSDHDGA